MSYRPPSVLLRLPRSAGPGPTRAEFNDAMQMIERADTQSAKLGTAANLAGLILTAPGGGSFQVTVDDAGNLHATAVPR